MRWIVWFLYKYGKQNFKLFILLFSNCKMCGQKNDLITIILKKLLIPSSNTFCTW